MKFSIITSNKNAQIVHVNDFFDLVNTIKNHTYSPSTFNRGRRLSSQFLTAEFLAFDIDSGLSIETTKKRLGGHAYIIAPTRSNMVIKGGQVCERFRILLPLESSIVDPITFKATYLSFMHHYLPEADSACCDVARQFFPSISIDSIHQGRSIYLAKPKSTAVPPSIKVAAPTRLGQLSALTEKFIKDPPRFGSGFNRALFSAAKDCQEQGHTFEATKQVLFNALSVAGGVAWDTNDIRTIKSAFLNPGKYAPRESNPYEECSIVRNAQDSADSRIVHTKHMWQTSLDLKVMAQELKQCEVIKAIFEYNPHFPQLFSINNRGETVFNTYNPPGWRKEAFYNKAPIQDFPIPPVYQDLFMHLVDKDLPSYNYLLDWVSESLRRRNFTMLTIISDEGTGKGVLYDILSALHGESNSHSGRDQVFKSHFNAQIINKTFFNVDEISLDDDEAMDRMKQVVNGRIEVEAKGKDAKSFINYANFMLTSNKLDGIRLSPSDRRFSIIQFTDTPLRNTPFIKQIEAGDHLKSASVAQLGAHLWNRTVLTNMKEPFRANIKLADIKEATLRDWERYVLYDMNDSHGGNALPLREVQDEVADKFPRLGTPGRRRFVDLSKKYPDYIAVKTTNYEIHFLKEKKPLPSYIKSA